MYRYTLVLCLVVSFSLVNLGYSQDKKTGPVIKEYGKVWKVENPDYKTDNSKEFKVVFDIMDSPESHEKVNPTIETAARFLNMHAQSGISNEKMKVALVVHNKASKDLMKNDAYRNKYGLDNPNAPLLSALLDVGVEIIFCGQSSVSSGIPPSATIDGVQIALSAMTALIQLQDEGFQLIKF